MGNQDIMTEWESVSLEYCKLMLCEDAAIVCRSKEDIEAVAVARLLKEVYRKNIVSFIEYHGFREWVDEISRMSKDKSIVIVITDGILDEMKNYSEIGKHKRSIIKRYMKLQMKLHDNVIKLSMPYLLNSKEEKYQFFYSHPAEIEKLMNELADERSRKTLDEIIRCCKCNDVFHYLEGTPTDKYWECYKHLPDEIWINCGGATGDTIVKYAHLKKYPYKAIYSYEGNSKEFQKLCWTVSKLNVMGYNNIHCINEYIGLNEQKNNFDNRYMNQPITLINMDIEGAEMGVLKGAKKVIQKWRPVLAICAYHKSSDLVEIAKMIRETVPDYKIYLRKYRSYSPMAFNEFVYYAVPLERVLDMDE